MRSNGSTAGDAAAPDASVGVGATSVTTEVEPPRRHVLDDGTAILVRPLVPADRAELRERYDRLSERSRRLRFVSAPDHLSAAMLDHLLDVDQQDRLALVAALADEPGAPGIGVARFVRDRDDPTVAEAAVTVVDDHQRRGIGTVLLVELVAAAIGRGIRTFVADVLWDNRELLESLRAVGADVVAGEPGLASVRVDLPADASAVPGSALHGVLRTAGAG